MAGATTVALVGAGYWGERLARNLAAAPGCELRTVCDVDGVRASDVAARHGGLATTSLASVLGDPDIDALAVATPATTHSGIVGHAIDAGRHVLVEKPLATTSGEAATLADRAGIAGLIVTCDQTYRFAPAVATIRDLVATPTFGEIRQVDSVRTNDGHDQPDVDVFWDLAYHDLAILDAVIPGGLADVLEVRAVSHDRIGLGRPHRGELSVQWRSGLRASVTVDWHAGTKVRDLRVTSDEHQIVWRDLDAGPRVHCDSVVVAVDGGPEPLAAVVDEFLAAIAAGRASSCGPDQELPVLAVLEAASRSAARAGAPEAVDQFAPRAAELTG